MLWGGWGITPQVCNDACCPFGLMRIFMQAYICVCVCLFLEAAEAPWSGWSGQYNRCRCVCVSASVSIYWVFSIAK